MRALKSQDLPTVQVEARLEVGVERCLKEDFLSTYSGSSLSRPPTNSCNRNSFW